MSETAVILTMLVSALCPMALVLGLVAGLLIARERVPQPRQAPTHQPSVMFERRPEKFTWVYNIPESAIGNLVGAMERDGEWKYAGRTHSANRTWHLKFMQAGFVPQ